MEAKVSLNFSITKYSDSEFSVKANTIIEKMTNNPAFPNPVPTIEQVYTAAAAYYNALDDVDDGSKHDTLVKNNCRKDLENKLKQLGSYVQWTSMGDATIITTSGFDLHQRREPVGPLQKVHDLIVKPGVNKGSLTMSWAVVPHAAMYEYEYAELPMVDGNGWIHKSTSKHKVLIEGLTSGKQYAFRVTGSGADPSRQWSDEVTSFVL
jgi:hypothetical protein